MKSFSTTTTAAPARLLRRGLSGLTVVLVAGTISFGLAQGRFGNRPSSLSAPAGAGIYGPLDQHERHPRGFVEYSTPLDQHERHAADLPSNTYAPLDQHERHAADLPSNTYGPLDQHERHLVGLPSN